MFTQNHQEQTPSATQPKTLEPSPAQRSINPLDLTACKRPDLAPIYSQITPKPQRKILLYGQNQERHLFPLLRDRDIGISGVYQNVVFESMNDDDRRTSSTQMQRGMMQTLEDLYDVVSRPASKSSYFTQRS